jgi:hypothetical protein
MASPAADLIVLDILGMLAATANHHDQHAFVTVITAKVKSHVRARPVGIALHGSLPEPDDLSLVGWVRLRLLIPHPFAFEDDIESVWSFGSVVLSIPNGHAAEQSRDLVPRLRHAQWGTI